MAIRGMKRLVCGMLTLSMLVLATDRIQSADPKATHQEIIDVANGKAKAKDVAEKFSVEDIMHAFKPRAKGGIGVGKQGDNIVPDAIELKINALAKKSLAAPALTKEATAIGRMADITKAIGQITLAQEQKKNPADWKKFSQDMIKAADDLSSAAKGTPEEVNKAAKKLSASCNDCHSKFRDN